MAIITILLSCALGAIAGLFQLTFLGASFGQAFLTYLTVSLVLSAAAIGAVVVIGFFRCPDAATTPLAQDDMDTWQDWHKEEAMEADRLRSTADRHINGPADGCRSDVSTGPNTPRLAEATAYSARRAGKV